MEFIDTGYEAITGALRNGYVSMAGQSVILLTALAEGYRKILRGLVH